MRLIIYSRILSWAALLGPHGAIMFAYADDLAILPPSAEGLNGLLDICREFVNDHIIQLSTRKTVVLLVRSRKYRNASKPNIYLGSTVFLC